MEDDLLYPFQYGEEANRFFVNCSGLTYNHMRERTLVLSFLMFKVISIFVLKLSKFESKGLSFDIFNEFVSGF